MHCNNIESIVVHNRKQKLCYELSFSVSCLRILTKTSIMYLKKSSWLSKHVCVVLDYSYLENRTRRFYLFWNIVSCIYQDRSFTRDTIPFWDTNFYCYYILTDNAKCKLYIYDIYVYLYLYRDYIFRELSIRMFDLFLLLEGTLTSVKRYTISAACCTVCIPTV